MPPILHSVRQHAKGKLNELRQELFNNIDDALFEMADRSRSDTEQSLYFSSMREIRLQRKNIAQEFMRRFYRGFEQAFDEAAPAESLADAATTADDIALLNNDELEISVAIAGMTSKVTSQHSLPIMQLTKRIDHLSKATDVTELLNPLGPEKLSLSFVQALECVDLDIKVRIILLKLYERFVMERLAPIYNEANLLLADAGVLPNLKNMPRLEIDSGVTGARAREESSTPTPQSGQHREREAGNEDHQSQSGGYAIPAASFAAIQSLMAAARGSARAPVRQGPSISTADLLTVLSAAQGDLLAPINIEEVPALLDLRQLVVNCAPEVTGNKSGGYIRQMTMSSTSSACCSTTS